ncbi:unnamed protein product, partial [Prunus brigantina]
ASRIQQRPIRQIYLCHERRTQKRSRLQDDSKLSCYFCHVLAMENLARAVLLVGFRDRHLIVLVVVDLLPGNMKSFFFSKQTN